MDSILEWLSSILTAITCVGEKVICVAKVFIKFLMDLVLWGPRYLYREIADYLGAFIKSTHIGEVWTQVITGITAFEDVFGYWWDLFELSSMLSSVITALILRFILRHLPVIGG
ncbi:hypothetical protein [Methylomonas koyamae]|uniref:Uncharacterized protein n=1 Tax=Methylomonas koyamae TaxID=702114 RepID=A0A291IJZ3_9GAMM|nr:hypothetical protein [Methylomonas koyamae]ATG90526.1 hypothetical protein MKLM6_2303 [Methylomonas koyamae]OAI30065.1 hypothetical protein A1356_22505 [Methylomonas koyamae]